jgi:hypothetical protein
MAARPSMSSDSAFCMAARPSMRSDSAFCMAARPWGRGKEDVAVRTSLAQAS